MASCGLTFVTHRRIISEDKAKFVVLFDESMDEIQRHHEYRKRRSGEGRR